MFPVFWDPKLLFQNFLSEGSCYLRVRTGWKWKLRFCDGAWKTYKHALVTLSKNEFRFWPLISFTIFFFSLIEYSAPTVGRPAHPPHSNLWTFSQRNVQHVPFHMHFTVLLLLFSLYHFNRLVNAQNIWRWLSISWLILPRIACVSQWFRVSIFLLFATEICSSCSTLSNFVLLKHDGVELP